MAKTSAGPSGSRWDPGGLLGLQIPWRALGPRWVRFPHAPAKCEGLAISLPSVIGTAGHVDHGKTALVKALTGVDTDRLPEEKAREISIELGFAPLTLPTGQTCSVIDVPGHERFIKNMLAGATGVDVVLLVVDAREGVAPQTREHLDILGLLGVRAGVAALTKIDTVDAAEVAPAASALSEYLAGTVLAGCPVIPVSAHTGEGLDALLAALAGAVENAGRAAATADPASPGPARLAIDRAFLRPGFGVVVTGTVASGRISQGQRLEIQPGGTAARVRRVEVHGRSVPAATAGERAALNLVGDLRPEALRGRVAAEPGSLTPSRVVGLHLRLLPTAAAPLSDLARVRLHAGTSETLGRVILPEGRALRPGEETPVVFEAESSLALASGQAFVIRTYSPPHTIGGGRVLRPDLSAVTGDRPRSKAARREAATALAEVSRSVSPGDPPVALPVPGGSAPLARYLKSSGLASPPPGIRVLAGGQHVADETFYQKVWLEALPLLQAQHEARPHLATLGREGLRSWLESRKLAPAAWLASFAGDGLIVLDAGRVRLASWSPKRPEALARAIAEVSSALRGAGFTPPSLAELPGALAPVALEVLLEEGEVICLTGVAGALSGVPVFHRDTLALARARVEDHLRDNGTITVAAFRDLIGATRKFALPLLELLDRDKVTQRRGDLRVKHPDAGGGP